MIGKEPGFSVKRTTATELGASNYCMADSLTSIYREISVQLNFGLSFKVVFDLQREEEKTKPNGILVLLS